jgi:hypothetical protein
MVSRLLDSPNSYKHILSMELPCYEVPPNGWRTDVEKMSEIVFGYGSNMCSGRFRNYGVEPIGRGRAAFLEGYLLDFSKQSKRDGSGKANVSPSAGHLVWGVLYEIHDADLAQLDMGEGTGYKRSKVTLIHPAYQDNRVELRKGCCESSRRQQTTLPQYFVLHATGIRSNSIGAHTKQNPRTANAVGQQVRREVQF